MNLQDAIQKGVDASVTPEMLALRFRHTATFRDAEGSEWPLQYSLRDPQQINTRAVAAAEAASRSFEVPYQDLRVLTPMPGQTLPATGAKAEHFNRRGELEGEITILDWGQESDFTSISRGTCVLRR